jgi:hypothetical protein
MTIFGLCRGLRRIASYLSHLRFGTSAQEFEDCPPSNELVALRDGLWNSDGAPED